MSERRWGRLFRGKRAGSLVHRDSGEEGGARIALCKASVSVVAKTTTGTRCHKCEAIYEAEVGKLDREGPAT